MHETFRLRSKVKHLGIVLTLFFAVACLLSLSLCFLPAFAEVPVTGLFALAVLVVVSLAVWGSMLLMSLYTWAAYYLESFKIDGTTLTLRTMVQWREVEVAELEALVWRARPQGGSIVFRTRDSRFRLDLWGYGEPERLAIIRALRELVPPQIQEGWPEFCSSVALPLRDGYAWVHREEPGAKVVVITRRRYDVALAVTFVFFAVLAIALWAIAAVWQAVFVLPFVILMWLWLRYQIPPEGREVSQLTSTSRGRMACFVVGILLLFQGLVLGLPLAGIDADTAEWIGGGVAVSMMGLCIAYVAWAERRVAKLPGYKSPTDRLAEAEEMWEQGEEDATPAATTIR